MKRNNDPAIERLSNVPLFASCTRNELALISSKVNEHHARAGDVLIREGGLGREFVVIVEGIANVLIVGRPIARLGPGDFGEIALLDMGPRTATVVAETDLVAQISSPPEFAALVAGAPNLARKLLTGLATRLRAADLQLTT